MTKSEPVTRQTGATHCGWCGVYLGGTEHRFFCPDCQADNAPCCQCGDRDCYLFPDGTCPECTVRYAPGGEAFEAERAAMQESEAERIAAREQAIYDAGRERGWQDAQDDQR